MARYAEVSRLVRSIFEEFTFEVEPLALDEAFLDISGSLRLFGGPLALATKLKQRVFEAVQLPVSVGVAPTKLVAKIACTLSKPNGLKLVLPRDVQALLDPLPIGRLWGIGPVLAQKLSELGIHTVGELRQYDEQWLQRLLGERANELQARARGEDARAVESDRAPKSYGEENTFERDVMDRDSITAALTAHSEAVAHRLRHDGYVGKTVTLKLKYAKRQRVPQAERAAQRLYPLVTRCSTLSTGTDDGAVIARTAIALWDKEGVSAPIRLVGVSLTGLQRNPAQLNLFQSESKASALGSTLDAIQQRFGSSAIRRGAKNPEKLTPSLRLKRGQ